MKTKFNLVPGIYRRDNRPGRMLLGMVAGRCVYSFDYYINSPRINASCCSPRSFLAAAGDTPSIVFTASDLAKLAEKMRSLRSFKHCNRFARWLFWGPAGLNKLNEAMKRQATKYPIVINPKSTSKIENHHGRPPGWFKHTISRLRNILFALLGQKITPAPA